jgi:Fe-S cluster assembly protein SufD
MTELAPWIEATRARVAELAGNAPEWLAGLRSRAVEEFERIGFPTRRDEEWRYTNVRPIVEGPFRAPAAEQAAAVDLAPYTSDAIAGPRLVFVDGRYREDLSRVGDLPAGISIEPLSSALARDAAGLSGVLGSTPEGTHPFRALNTACFVDGLHLHAEAGATLEVPVHVLSLSGVAGAGACHLRHRIDVGRGAKVAVIEEYRGVAEAFTNVVTDVEVADGGTFSRVNICQEDDRSHHVGFLSVRQGAESQVHDLFLGLGGAIVRNEIDVILDGENGECTLYGLYHLDEKRQVDNHTLLRHAKSNCRSWELYRGILDDHSRGIFTGKIHVYPDAQKTDAKQNSNSILLSRDAEADTRPRLEIHADDVKCTHGATVGELDETALFYLRSRGINPEMARRMLVHAFAKEVLEAVDAEALRSELEVRLSESLGA